MAKTGDDVTVKTVKSNSGALSDPVEKGNHHRVASPSSYQCTLSARTVFLAAHSQWRI